MFKEIVLATHNKFKIQEIKDLLANTKVKILTCRDFSGMPKVAEKGKTLEENAIQKAIAIARFTKKLALSDDSGLMVDALGGKPGVYSSRFAGKNCSFLDNNTKLLKMMKKVPLNKRSARFSCVIVLTDGREFVEIAEGVCEGYIAAELSGKHGFGYDPLFVPSGSKKTFAELSCSEKNKISHRSKALNKMKKMIENYLKQHKDNNS